MMREDLYHFKNFLATISDDSLKTGNRNNFMQIYCCGAIDCLGSVMLALKSDLTPEQFEKLKVIRQEINSEMARITRINMRRRRYNNSISTSQIAVGFLFSFLWFLSLLLLRLNYDSGIQKE